MSSYFVTREDGQTFHGRFTLDEIRTRHLQGVLPGTFHATESDSRSFTSFARNNDARWRTVTELLAEQLNSATPAAGLTKPHRAQLSDHIVCDAPLPRVILAFAAFLSIFGLFASPVIFLASVTKGAVVATVLMAGVMICINVAFIILCGRAIALESIVMDQDAENRRLWLAIDELRAAKTNAETDASAKSE